MQKGSTKLFVIRYNFRFFLGNLARSPKWRPILPCCHPISRVSNI